MELLKPIIEAKNPETLLGPYLHSCQEQLSFFTQDANEEKSLITAINCKLNEPSTRFVGLSLLHTFLQSCPQNTVIENAISWMSLCVKGTVSPVASTCNLSYHVLSQLFHLCSDQAKHVASAVLPKLFERLQSVPKHCIPAALSCLESCMKIYSGSCGPHKNSIQTFLFPLLEYNGPNKAAVVWKASVCIALLPQIGGGGAGGLTHQENWTQQLKAACSTLHEILDVLFSSVHELEVHNVEATREETFSFESTEEIDPISKAYALAARFDGVVCCVQAMLLGEFGVVKNVPPSAVLGVICRGLGVTSVSLQTISTTESLALLTLLPNLQTKLFELMRTLIDCCGANLLPFGRLVVKLVLQTLKWTVVKDWKHKTKPYRFIRTAAYRSIKHWLDCVRTVPTCEEVAELVEMACSDFRSEVDGVRLLTGKKKSKYADRNEAKRKRAANAAAASSVMEIEGEAVEPAASKLVCIAALETVQALVAVHGWALSGGSYSTLYETVVKLIVSVSSQPDNPAILFGDAEARLELYRLLSALIMHPHPHVAAPIRMAWRLFSLGQNDPNLKVSTFCSEALSSVEKIVHPSFVPLALPPPETEEEKITSDKLTVSTAFREKQNTDATSREKEITDAKNASRKKQNTNTKNAFEKLNTDAKIASREKQNTDAKNAAREKQNTDANNAARKKQNTDANNAAREKQNTDAKSASREKQNTDTKNVFRDKQNADAKNALREKENTDAKNEVLGKTKEDPVKQTHKEADEETEQPSEDTTAQEKLSNGVDQEMIDLSDSGSNAEIEEVPVEIDLVDSEASDGEDTPPAVRESSDEVEIIIGLIDQSSPVEDFRLALSPDPDSVREEAGGSRRKKRRGECREANEKGVVTNSIPVNGGGEDGPPPSKVVVVSADENVEESNVDAMLASFVDKVKPIYEELSDQRS